ncbi:MAG: sulfatase-like hydrolase/transferase, partial [Cyclobacteriaceae bacterium]
GRNDPGYRFSDNEFTYFGPVEDRDRAYVEMVEVMDEGIGEILQTLEELGLEENTLVVFISDNGGEKFGHNGILNGSKGSLLEAGHRVPAIAYWKGKIKPGISDATVMSFDWMPTFISLINAKNNVGLQLDGIDLSEHLLGGSPLPERNLFWRYRTEKVIRQSQHKLLINETDTMLFDLQKDLGESQNLAEANPALVQSLSKSYHAWELEMNKVTQKTK